MTSSLTTSFPVLLKAKNNIFSIAWSYLKCPFSNAKMSDYEGELHSYTQHVMVFGLKFLIVLFPDAAKQR